MESWVSVLLWAITAMMALMSVVLLSGNGGFLIAGYNTANQRQRAKYDERKLSTVMGIGLSVITLTLAFSLSFNFRFPNPMIDTVVISLIVLSAAFMLIAGNTICLKKKA